MHHTVYNVFHWPQGIMNNKWSTTHEINKEYNEDDLPVLLSVNM